MNVIPQYKLKLQTRVTVNNDPSGQHARVAIFSNTEPGTWTKWLAWHGRTPHAIIISLMSRLHALHNVNKQSICELGAAVRAPADPSLASVVGL